MTESRFDIILHGIDGNLNTHTLAQKLSKLFNANFQQLEMQLVKAKLSRGMEEALVSGLTKKKAEKYQQILSRIGLKTSLTESISLVPIRKVKKINKFTCPACGLKQEAIENNELQTCSSCGVVREKYEEVQAIKKYEQDVIRHNRLLEEQENAQIKKSTQEKYNKQLSRSLNKNLKTKKYKKKKRVVLLTVILGISTVGAASSLYLNNSSKKNNILEAEKQTVQKTFKHSKQKSKLLEQKVTTTKAFSDKKNEGLVNPYQKFSNPNSKKISAKEGVKRINSLLKNKKLKLPQHDKVALEKISTIYKKVEVQTKPELDYNSVLYIASSIKNKNVKYKVIQQLLLEEIKNGLKTFQEFDIYPTPRKGENDPTVIVSNKLIDVFISVKQFEKASKEARQIKDNYLRVVALNKIMESMVNGSAIKKKSKQANMISLEIENISKQKELGMIQRSLILGVLAKGKILLDNKKAGEEELEKARMLARQIIKPEDRIKTFIRLSEDQREVFNYKDASTFLNEASRELKKNKKKIVNQDKIYTLLTKQYLKMFDFLKARKYSQEINNNKQKGYINQVIKKIKLKVFSTQHEG